MNPVTGTDLLLADPDPRESRRTKVARRVTLGALFLIVSIGLIGILYTVTIIRATQLDNRATIASADRAASASELALERVLDCTEPGGKCFEAGAKRTGEAVVGINEGTLRVIVAALSCQADGITGQRELARCTAKRAEATPDQPSGPQP